ncbi:MAG: PEP-CTERM-box response regulator transcription factor [Candidatus Krumholzibacteria bacterium]|nr:PEP-CTERM-box response regulator transcription factor [Candidatus Krumholzibacteria bacterium]
MPAGTLLIVDDEESILKQLQWAFKADFTVLTAQTAGEAIAAVKAKKPGLMLLDLSLTGEPRNIDGLAILEDAILIAPHLKIVVLTGHDERENALKAIERGAYDFCSKTIPIEELRTILKRAAHLLSLETELLALKRKEGARHEFEGIVAISKSMLDVFETVKRVAATDVSILITGESGTGKELIARAIHSRSPRRDNPFVPINCGAIPENLLESELFGHERGSFTGAFETRQGKFETADSGTTFLDEIGELSPPLQVKILRFLQEHIIERVGAREPIKVDVRIIAATNRNLDAMLAGQTFREDLFYRINTVSIDLPPLRDRRDDILLLAMRFLHRYNGEFSRNVRGFGEYAQRTLGLYAWPGNVRELENRVKRGVIMATGKLIQPEDLDLPYPEDLRKNVPGAEPSGAARGEAPFEPMPLKEAREELEHRFIVGALVRARGNVSAAAESLEVSRPTLHDLMKKHGVDPETYRLPKGK